ncbi:MAG: HlyD family secretion protein, partial [Muribaculaceae bacterium]|nr:HlyD family secretion protein [Muribaculaceae bacterium]
ICDVVLDLPSADGEDSSKAIVLPNSAVLLDSDNQNFVWLAKNGVARKQIVNVAGMVDNGLVISGGLASGDSVIVAGQQKVGNGTKVVPVK